MADGSGIGTGPPRWQELAGFERLSGITTRRSTTLERSLYKALHELQRLQAARDGVFDPAPKAFMF